MADAGGTVECDHGPRATCEKCVPNDPIDIGGTAEPDRYVWDWVNTGDEVFVVEEGRTRTVSESYVVRKPDGSILCFTSRYKRGYEEALSIAAAMNAGAQSGR